MEDRPRQYHNNDHTLKVINRTTKILTALGADQHQIDLARLCAAYHDVIINHESGSAENEAKSWYELRKYMDEVNQQDGPFKFTQDDFHQSEEAIMATAVRTINFQTGTVTYNYLETQSVIALALRLADLGSTGMGDFILDGTLLFNEINPEIPPNSPQYGQELKKWNEFQIKFAQKQQEFYNNLPPKIRIKLDPLFNQFEQSIKDAQKAAT